MEKATFNKKSIFTSKLDLFNVEISGACLCPVVKIAHFRK